MDNIYNEAIQAVEDGSNFRVDFHNRSLKLDGKFVINQNKYEGNLGLNLDTESDFLSHIEEIYLHYKHSVPSERSESKSHRYFKALSEKELDDEDMLYGERRDTAQIALELYVLIQIILGFCWNENTMGKWFWQSKNDKDLVLLRSWFETSDFNNKTVLK